MHVSEVVNNTAIVRLSDEDIFDLRDYLLFIIESSEMSKDALHKSGGVYELIGRLVGWPLGFNAEAGWVEFDEWISEVEV